MSKLKICMVQMEVIPAKPFINADNAIERLKKAKADGADIAIYSEMLIPGYILGDMWERQNFIEDCEAAELKLIRAAEEINMPIVFGGVISSPNLKNEDGRSRKYNVCFASDGKYDANRHKLFDYVVANKTLMPNYREFDDSRHFYDTRKIIFEDVITPNSKPDINKILQRFYRIYEFKGISCAFMLCEDGWDDDYYFKLINLFRNADIIINISCSPYTHGKNNKRNRVFGRHAKHLGKPLVYVNNVGCQNNGKTVFTFDGNSCIYDKDGNQINPYKPFEEGCETIEIDTEASFGSPSTNDIEDISGLYRAIRYGTKKYMEQNGIKRVVIGASGGVDSCLAAAIYADILDPKDLFLINMPSQYNSKTTIGIAEKLAGNIGCRYISHPIGSIVETLTEDLTERSHELSVDPINGEVFGISLFMLENVQARARLQVLAGYAAMVNGVFTCNSNKSEATIGYATLYGDLAGWLANLADLWKGQIYEMCKWYNENVKNIIPSEAFTVKPSAELGPNQNVDKGLGDPLNYPYHDQLFKSWVERWNRSTPEENLKWYLDGTIEKEIGYDGVYKLFPTSKEFIADLERWWNLFNGFSMAKRAWACPPVLVVQRRGFGFDLRESTSVQAYTKEYLEMKKKINC